MSINEYKLEEGIKKSKVVFFAGAGVSFDSGLVSPEDVIKGTCDRIVPEYRDSRDDLDGLSRLNTVVSIQPELFYSVLWGCCQDNNCLSMWKALRKKEWELFGKAYSPKPNINHYFIALYSFVNSLPILTVNFDPMFEEAATALGLSYKVLTHNDNPEHVTKGCLTICKLHGDIGVSGDLTTNLICTTIDSISRHNIKWAEYLEELFKEKEPCFIGYSGRDIDYFPHFCELSHNNRIINSADTWGYWIPAKQRITVEHADEVAALKIKKYPGDFFRERFRDDAVLGKACVNSDSIDPVSIVRGTVPG